jgi:hypothetical protein
MIESHEAAHLLGDADPELQKIEPKAHTLRRASCFLRVLGNIANEGSFILGLPIARRASMGQAGVEEPLT